MNLRGHGDESSSTEKFSRREALQLTGVALAFTAGCAVESGDYLAPPETQAEQSLAVTQPTGSHARHRIAYLTGDLTIEDPCPLDCTAFLHDHEYGANITWR
jgi:hypothetical protein